MSIEVLVSDAKKFIKSSAYRFGDRTGFTVNLTPGIILPGNSDPVGYLDKLGLETVPEKVMVVCAGNGGLAVECFARGAKQVVALEPRSRFNKGIQGVKRLLDAYWRLEDKHDCSLTWNPNWPKEGRDQGLKDFDLILWPEGVEEITSPKGTFQAIADCLSPGGRLIVELTHGKHQWVEKINSWRPSGHAVNEMAEAVFGSLPGTVLSGRSATMRIYVLTLLDEQAEAKAKAKAAEAKAAEEKKRKAAEAKAKKAKAEAAAAETEAEAKAEADAETEVEETAIKQPATPSPVKESKVELKTSEGPTIILDDIEPTVEDSGSDDLPI